MQTADGHYIIQSLLSKARQEGRNFAEVMEADGFLLTSARQRQIQVDALTGMLYILAGETAERVLRGHLEGRPGTAQDMFDAMVAWLQEYREAVVAGHVG